jgi:predicted transglutaminase-like cysteine proteinase
MFSSFPRAEKLGNLVAALVLLALALVLVLGSPARAGETFAVRLFGSAENAEADISPFPKWTGALARYARERQLENEPCAGACPLQQWKAFVAGLRGQDRMRQLVAVNAYINRTPYRPDAERFGMADYWATPREFLGQAGDCEDYVIAKYLSLRKLGWPAGALRLVVVKHETRNEVHAVLVAYLGGTAYVLDNLEGEVLEHAAIRHYRPIFSINEVAWHLHRDWNPASVAAVARAQPERAQPERAVPPPVRPAAPAHGPHGPDAAGQPTHSVR